MTGPVDVLAVMRQTAIGLHGVADECTNSEFAIVMNQRAQAMDAASAVVVELIDALRECAEADQPMAQMHATERARAALASAGAK